MKSGKIDPDLKKAHSEVELSRLELETSLNALDSKIQQFAWRIKAPDRMARKYPFANFALFSVVGFTLGSWISRKDGKRKRARLSSVETIDFTDEFHSDFDLPNPDARRAEDFDRPAYDRRVDGRD